MTFHRQLKSICVYPSPLIFGGPELETLSDDLLPGNLNQTFNVMLGFIVSVDFTVSVSHCKEGKSRSEELECMPLYTDPGIIQEFLTGSKEYLRKTLVTTTDATA